MQTNAAHAEQSLRAHIAGPNVDWDYVKSTLGALQVATEVNTRGSLADDAMGRSLLIDMLAKDPSVDAVDACLRAFPDALAMNISAFFMASRCGDLNIIRSLVRTCQERQSTEDKCPYPWITMSHVSSAAAEAIIRESPQGVLQQCQASKYCLLDRTLFSVDDFKHRRPDPSWWDKLVLMLKAAEHGTLEHEDHEFHPIHTLVHRVVTRPEFFKSRKVAQLIVWLLHQLRLKYPSLFRIVDGNGDTPLHVVLRAPCTAGPGTAYARDLIAVLVDAHSKSASLVTREDGRLPLFLGLENGWPCHDVLVSAAPHSLHRRDPVTCVYPFQVAACAKPACRKPTKRARMEGSSELDTVFSLLRQDPLQARGLMETNGET